MSDRKVFSELLETLHRGRDKPAEQQAPRGAAAGPQRKGGTNCPPKNTKSRSNPGKTSARERGKPSGSATVCNSGNTLDWSDLEQRYGKLNLTSVRPACSWSSPTKGQPVSDSCSPMQIQASQESSGFLVGTNHHLPVIHRPCSISNLSLFSRYTESSAKSTQSPNGGAEPAKELSPAEAYRAALAAASMPPSFMGQHAPSPYQHLASRHTMQETCCTFDVGCSSSGYLPQLCSIVCLPPSSEEWKSHRIAWKAEM